MSEDINLRRLKNIEQSKISADQSATTFKPKSGRTPDTFNQALIDISNFDVSVGTSVIWRIIEKYNKRLDDNKLILGFILSVLFCLFYGVNSVTDIYESIRSKKDAALTHIARANRYMDFGEFSSASQEYKIAKDLFPENSESDLGFVLSDGLEDPEFKKSGSRQKTYVKISSIGPEATENPYYLYYQSSYYESSDDDGIALAYCDRALQLKPNFIAAILLRGKINEGLDHLNRAESDYLKALSYAPQYSVALSDLGEVLFYAGNFSKAVKYDEKSYSQNRNLRTVIDTGDAYLFLGDFEKAFSAYENAIDLHNDYQSNKDIYVDWEDSDDLVDDDRDAELFHKYYFDTRARKLCRTYFGLYMSCRLDPQDSDKNRMSRYLGLFRKFLGLGDRKFYFRFTDDIFKYGKTHIPKNIKNEISFNILHSKEHTSTELMTH